MFICFLFHSLLHSDRDAIPEVPAIYFVLPSEENVKRICQVGSLAHSSYQFSDLILSSENVVVDNANLATQIIFLESSLHIFTFFVCFVFHRIVEINSMSHIT